MGSPVRLKESDSLHLDHKEKIGFIAVPDAADKLFHMLEASLGGGIGKTGNLVFFKGHALDFHEGFSPGRFHIQIKS